MAIKQESNLNQRAIGCRLGLPTFFNKRSYL